MVFFSTMLVLSKATNEKRSYDSFPFVKVPKKGSHNQCCYENYSLLKSLLGNKWENIICEFVLESDEFQGISPGLADTHVTISVVDLIPLASRAWAHPILFKRPLLRDSYPF